MDKIIINSITLISPYATNDEYYVTSYYNTPYLMTNDKTILSTLGKDLA